MQAWRPACGAFRPRWQTGAGPAGRPPAEADMHALNGLSAGREKAAPAMRPA